MVKINPKYLYFLLFFIALACDQDNGVDPDQDDDCLVTKSSSTGAPIPGRYIIAFPNADATGGRSKAKAARVFQSHVIPTARIRDNFSGAFETYVVDLSDDEAAALKADPEVAAVEPDRVISVCACFTVVEPDLVTWNVDKVGYGDGTGKTAWVLDTGIDLNHPDLNVDQARSKSFVKDETSADDNNGHGTHIAGIIGAKNNDIGTLGVASGAKVIALKVLSDNGEGFLSVLLNALTHVRNNGKAGEVVNISIGVNEISDVLDKEVKALSDRGIFVTVASGNDGQAADQFSPARANGKNIYTVTAIDSLNQFAGFSNFGNNVVDFAAPGVRIASSYSGGRYAIMSGTSMASPHVAGLLLLTNGKLTSEAFAIDDPDGTPDPIAHR